MEFSVVCIIRLLFKGACWVAAVMMVLYWMFEFSIKDEDLSIVDYKTFYQETNIMLPEVSLCIENPFIEDKINFFILNFNNLNKNDSHTVGHHVAYWLRILGADATDAEAQSQVFHEKCHFQNYSKTNHKVKKKEATAFIDTSFGYLPTKGSPSPISAQNKTEKLLLL